MKYSPEEVSNLVNSGKISMWDACAYMEILDDQPDSWIDEQREIFKLRWQSTLKMIRKSKYKLEDFRL